MAVRIVGRRVRLGHLQITEIVDEEQRAPIGMDAGPAMGQHLLNDSRGGCNRGDATVDHLECLEGRTAA